MNKKILIIGGMGPQASLFLHKQIIEASVKDGAKHGYEYPEIVHLSLPVKDFISSTRYKNSALKLIRNRLECLWRLHFYKHNNCLQHCTFTNARVF